MNNKLISFSLLLSMLCTTNIVFGMNIDDNNPFSDGYEVQLTSLSAQNKTCIQTINNDGKLSQQKQFSSAPLQTHTGELTLLNKQTEYQLFYTSVTTKETLSSPINIPDAIINTIINNQSTLLNSNEIITIQTNDQMLRVELKTTETLLNALRRKINYKDTATTFTKKNQSSYPWSVWIGVPVIFLASIVTAYFYFFRK